jgi:hypothetical protein
MKCQNRGAMVSKLPGPVCVSQTLVSIEDGTLARVCSARPGVATIPDRLAPPVFNKFLAESKAAGHIQITDGAQWVSDVKQKDSLWPNRDQNSTWQKETPPYSIYRYPDE